MSVLRTEGEIYFIACEPLEAVKIGFTAKDPEARVKACQTGCPAPLKLLGSFPGTMLEERRLHEAFTPLHIRGEWFRHEWKLWAFIEWMRHRWTRQGFIDSLHDVLMQDGGWHPNCPITNQEYGETGSWEPFRDLLWRHFGPWEDAE